MKTIRSFPSLRTFHQFPPRFNL